MHTSTENKKEYKKNINIPFMSFVLLFGDALSSAVDEEGEVERKREGE